MRCCLVRIDNVDYDNRKCVLGTELNGTHTIQVVDFNKYYSVLNLLKDVHFGETGLYGITDIELPNKYNVTQFLTSRLFKIEEWLTPVDMVYKYLNSMKGTKDEVKRKRLDFFVEAVKCGNCDSASRLFFPYKDKNYLQDIMLVLLKSKYLSDEMLRNIFSWIRYTDFYDRNREVLCLAIKYRCSVLLYNGNLKDFERYFKIFYEEHDWKYMRADKKELQDMYSAVKLLY